ncbi:hypothetical protein [Mycolicibacterium aubagnense]|uniref:hypothetical protein n=1 Tax=Mycolicibacterium aubagnense TaxID=319707 RepID=UPI0010FE5B03|nr:hypothetical protein [Mycolicibacterium aubagnense]TLH64272.1 hypothetical protein C1S80_12735 [Mycolicibacterium aubagnense]
MGSVFAAGQAIDDAEHGNYVGAILNGIGVIPGPVGWIALGADLLWEQFGADGHSSYGLWDPPNGTDTHMLPGAAAQAPGVRDADASLTAVQQKIFSFADGPAGTVWNSNPPNTLRLDTPEVQKAVTDWLQGIAEVFAQIDHTLSNSGEPYMQQYREKLASQFTAMAKLPAAAKLITAQLTAASDAADKQYKAMIDTNHKVRQQLANDGQLSDSGPATSLANQMTTGQTAIAAASDKLSKLFGDTVATLAPAARPAPSNKPATPNPAAPAPAAPHTVAPATPPPTSPATPAKDAPKDDISKLLSSLGNKSPLGGSPLGGSPFGGSPMGGSPLGGTPLGGTPSAKPSEGTPLVDPKKDGPAKPKPDLAASKPDNKGAQVAAPLVPPAPPAAPAPAAAVPGPGAPKPAAATAPNTTVDVKGHKVTFPDPKTAKMMEILAKADPNHPISLAEAAAKAGLNPPVPGQDPGHQIAPSEAKPGDVLVAAGKQYLLLGDGKFYDLTSFKEIDAKMLPQDMGDQAGYFRLSDPTAPGAPGTTAAVSGPTTGAVPFSVPGADGSAPAVPAPPVPAPPAPAAHAAPAGPQSVPQSGNPGVPAAGTGGGPANVAATDTGLRAPAPSATAPKLDPSAVK